MAKEPAAYVVIVQKIFFDHYKKGKQEFEFTREEIAASAKQLGVKLPKKIWRRRLHFQIPEAVAAIDIGDTT